MPQYRSRTSTAGRNMAGARALWRATGMQDEDFEKPIIAVVNSFTQFVPGHVHLKDLGQLVAREIEAAGGVAKEFNTIAVDDGIAMGHDGMLYSLPSRDLIAEAKAVSLTHVFVLTTQSTHWFLEQGFEAASLDDLPVEKQQLYNWQRNAAVLRRTV